MQKKPHWLTQHGFHSSTGYDFCNKNTLKNEVKNYVRLTPSEPPMLHKFREVDKSKHLTQKFLRF